jgi:hypothetical protein
LIVPDEGIETRRSEMPWTRCSLPQVIVAFLDIELISDLPWLHWGVHQVCGALKCLWSALLQRFDLYIESSELAGSTPLQFIAVEGAPVTVRSQHHHQIVHCCVLNRFNLVVHPRKP